MADVSAAPRARSWGVTDLWMLVAVTIWGLNFTVVKIALRDFSPLAFNGVRFAFATVVILAILWLRSRAAGELDPLTLPGRDWLTVAVLGLLGHAAYQVLFINGMARTMPANSSLLLATTPMWVVIIGYFLRVERVNRATWLGILVSFSGIAVLILGGGGELSLGRSSTLAGDLMLLGCAIVWASYTTGSKPLLARHSPLKLTALTMLVGATPLFLISLPAIRRQDWGAVTPIGWGALIFSALLALVAAYLIWYTSVKRVGNARTAIYSNLTPIVGILFAWAVLGSTLAPLQFLGAAVVLLGLVLTRRGRRG